MDALRISTDAFILYTKTPVATVPNVWQRASNIGIPNNHNRQVSTMVITR